MPVRAHRAGAVQGKFLTSGQHRRAKTLRSETPVGRVMRLLPYWDFPALQQDNDAPCTWQLMSPSRSVVVGCIQTLHLISQRSLLIIRERTLFQTLISSSAGAWAQSDTVIVFALYSVPPQAPASG